MDFDIRSAHTANGVVLTAFVKGQTFKFYPDDTEYTKRITYKELKNLLSNV